MDLNQGTPHQCMQETISKDKDTNELSTGIFFDSAKSHNTVDHNIPLENT